MSFLSMIYPEKDHDGYFHFVYYKDESG